MKNIIKLIALVLVLHCVPVNAQETSRRAKAEELLDAMNMPESVEQAHMNLCRQLAPKLLATQIKKQQQADQGTKRQDLARHTDRIVELMAEEFSWKKVKEDYVTLYAQTFSEEELKGLLDFYKSDAGRALVKKQPELITRTAELGIESSTRIMMKLQDMVQKTNEWASEPPVSKKSSEDRE